MHIYFLDTNIFLDLTQQGWEYAHQKYFLHEHSRHRNRKLKNKPTQQGTPIILIPIHINNYHWVAVTRHETQTTTRFYISDDMNIPEAATYIKQQFHTKCNETAFHSHDTK